MHRFVKYTNIHPCHFHTNNGVFSIADQNVCEDSNNADKVHASSTFDIGILSLLRVLKNGTGISRQP